MGKPLQGSPCGAPCRELAGQLGGGRWTTGSIGESPAEAGTQEETIAPDGSRVLTIRIRPDGRAEWDEQHTVTSPDGARTVVETSDRTQTIRDGESGAILARSTLTERGVVPEAFVQTVLSGRRGLSEAVTRAVTALGTLFTALSARNDYGKVIWARPSTAYETLANFLARPIWVGGCRSA